MSFSDQAVLRRWITRHDAEAFRAIVQRHAGMVYATCRRILRNDSEAEEITQECFESLVRTTECEQPRQLGPWLHGMATRKCLMRLRAEGRRRQREAEYAAGQVNSAEPQWNDIYSYVDEAIAELPQEIRSPVVAHFLYGQSHGTIARATGVPRRTVSNRIKRGLELVGESLKRRGIPVAISALTAMMAAHFTAEAAPATLAAALGKLALAHSANAAAGISVSGTTGLLGSMVTLKTAIVVIGATLAVIGGLWVAKHATHRARVESREAIRPSLESLAGDLAPAADELEPQSALSPAEQDEGPQQSVSGTVQFYGTEEPAPGVIVKLWCQNKWVDETVTDENGRYMLVGLMPGLQYLLRTTSEEGYTAFHGDREVRLDEGESRTEVDFILAPNGLISGKVSGKRTTYHRVRLGYILSDVLSSDSRLREIAMRALVAEENRPFPGVRVLLAEKGLHNSKGRMIDETVSDGEGRYTFPSVRPGGYLVWAEATEGAVQVHDRYPGTYSLVDLQAAEQKTDVDLFLRIDGVSITGRVTDYQGDPVEGAEVVAKPLEHFHPSRAASGFEYCRSKPVGTESDANGQYRLDGLLPASLQEVSGYLKGGSLPYDGRTFTVRARAEGYASAEIVVPAIPESLVSVVIAFMREQERLGLALDPNGLVKEYPEPLLPSDYGDVISNIDLVLDPETVLAGRLLDTRGNAMPNSRIRMVFAQPPDTKSQPFVQQATVPDWVETDEEGAFRLYSVPAGVYLFEADTGAGAQRTRNEPMTVLSGTVHTGIDVIVEAAEDRGDIEGHVISAATGAPVEDFSLRVANVDAPTEESPRHGEMTTDKPSGTFRIEGLSPGVATLELKAPGYAREQIKVNVEPGQTTPVRFELAPEGVLRGYVTRNGQPSGHGYVTIPNVEHSQYCGTNEEGYYELRELKAGTYLVNFTMWLYEDARGGAQACERLWVDVESGQETRLDIDYQGSGVVHGTFEGPEEYKWAVRVFDSSLPEEDQLRAGTWKFKANRHYEIVDLPPGTYTVVGICTGEDGAVLEKSETVSLDEGGTARVDFIF